MPALPYRRCPTTVTLRPISLGETGALFYYHQRIRLEGSDIKWMMDAAAMKTPIPARTREVATETASLEEFRG